MYSINIRLLCIDLGWVLLDFYILNYVVILWPYWAILCYDSSRDFMVVCMIFVISFIMMVSFVVGLIIWICVIMMMTGLNLVLGYEYFEL